MNQATKEFRFCYGHRLSNYVGKCRNLHGHNAILLVTVSGELDELGMVVDFNKLSLIFKDYIEPKFDHKMILKKDDEINQKIAMAVESLPDCIYWMDCNPTAENMAIEILNTFKWYFHDSEINIVKVRLYETSTSYAEVYHE
jgi:6-pyruvoyltetrahydropterin/6-carboxytetrahydropterin synthase